MDFDDLIKENGFDPNQIKNLSGIEKMQFIEYVLGDLDYVINHKSHPKLIKYYKNVLSELIKTYGH